MIKELVERLKMNIVLAWTIVQAYWDLITYKTKDDTKRSR